MSTLYRDILYPIFVELQYDIKSLASCLRVNKTWCEIVIPILWRNPWECSTYKKKKLLFDTIISHLPDEARTNLNQHFSFISSITKSHKRPMFNYISFCKHLNLEIIESMANFNTQYHNEIRNKLLKLFINENAKYTHLYIMSGYSYEYLIPGAEQCLSEIKFLRCDGRVHDKNLVVLTKVCRSIKELQLFINNSNNNYGMSKLIENQESLFRISYLYAYSRYDTSFCKVLEKSLVKHANTIQYFNTCVQPQSHILASFVNLKTLILKYDQREFDHCRWYYIENVSLPSLQFLDADVINTESLTSLIKNSGEKLTKIRISNSITFTNMDNHKKIIQAIYQSCPNLMYLKLFYIDANVLELKKLLIKCQYLNKLGFYLSTQYLLRFSRDQFIIDWDNFFDILAALSPPSLFKFTFYYPANKPELESLKLFFDNWEGRHPMSLIIKTESNFTNKKQLDDLINSYKAKGVIKKFVYSFHEDDNSKATTKGVVKDLVTGIINGFKNIF